MKYIILVIPLLFSGCFGTNPINTSPQLDTTPKVSANLKEECPPIEKWKDQTFGTILQHDVDTTVRYAECRKKHKELVEAIDKQK